MKLLNKKLIFVCGSGGVGKTTTAAGIALKAALQGKKSIVITIDPAKRLATSLGLKGLSGEPSQIDPKLLEKISKKKNVQFYAMMLDAKSTFDHLVVKYSPTQAIRDRILENKIYQHLSGMIAGSQEYMAMEKVYEFINQSDYECIVIDTPPTVHAIDFLDAPNRMVDAMSNSMIHVLIKPAALLGGWAKFLLKAFDRVTGFAFLQDISEMLIAFQSLIGGFKERAADVQKIFVDSSTTFVMVAACETNSVKETHYFVAELKKRNLPLSGIILNRYHQWEEVSNSDELLAEKVGAALAKKMIKVFNNFKILAERDDTLKEELKKLMDKEGFVQTVPFFDKDIHDLEGLNRLGSYLI